MPNIRNNFEGVKMLKYIMVVLLLSSCCFAFDVIPRPEWADPDIVGDYQIIHVEDSVCPRTYWAAQYDLVDSEGGFLQVDYIDLPPEAVEDGVGGVVFHPTMPGIFYIKSILYCTPPDPNACVWPNPRYSIFIIRVEPEFIWDVELILIKQ